MECHKCCNTRELDDLEQVETCGHIFCYECLRGQSNCLDPYCCLPLPPMPKLDFNNLPQLTEDEPIVITLLREKEENKTRQIAESLREQQEWLVLANTCTSGIWKNHLMHIEHRPETKLTCCGRIICAQHINSLLISVTALIEHGAHVYPLCCGCNGIIKKLLQQLKQTEDPVVEDAPTPPDEAEHSYPSLLSQERFENEEKYEYEYDDDARKEQPNQRRKRGMLCEGLLCERDGDVRLENCGHWSCVSCITVVCQCACYGVNRLPLCPQEQCNAVLDDGAVEFASSFDSGCEDRLFHNILNRLRLHRIRLSKSSEKQSGVGQVSHSPRRPPTIDEEFVLSTDVEAEEDYSYEQPAAVDEKSSSNTPTSRDDDI